MKFVKHERIWLKDHPELNEKWVQERIAEDTSILGLGDLVLKDKERTQPRAGRLDLLLQDVDTDRRYEVEVQLGRTDESHIIRAIEYWDIERKRYPQYDHCGVIVAEDITSRHRPLQQHYPAYCYSDELLPHRRSGGSRFQHGLGRIEPWPRGRG